MRYRFRLGATSLVLLGLGVLSCSSRSPVSQAKDGTRAATAVDGAAAAVRMHALTDTGGREAPRDKSGTPPAVAPEESATTGPQVGYAVAFGTSTDAKSLPPAAPEGDIGE